MESLGMVYFGLLVRYSASIFPLKLMSACKNVSCSPFRHITMRTDQTLIANELIAALGVLGYAQEHGVDDDRLSELAARVRNVESEFRLLSGQSAVA